MSDNPPQPNTTQHAPGWVMLDVIAFFKFVKAATLVMAGLGGLGLLSSRVEQSVETWLEHLALGHAPRLIATMAERALPTLATAGPRKLILLSLAAFLYAAVFIVEGIGLWRGRRWAEYLTIVVTASLLSFEIVALVKKTTPIRAGTLAINVVVVAYLVWRVWSDRRDQQASGKQHARWRRRA